MKITKNGQRPRIGWLKGAALVALLTLSATAAEAAPFVRLKKLTNLNDTNQKKIRDAAEHVNRCFASERFRRLVLAETRWDYTRNNSETIWRDLTARTFEIEVGGYWPRWRWSKTIARTWHGSGRFEMNLRKIGGRSVRQIANTIAHEVAHLANESGSSHGYAHGGNSSSGKQHSVPYKIGQMVEDFDPGTDAGDTPTAGGTGGDSDSGTVSSGGLAGAIGGSGGDDSGADADDDGSDSHAGGSDDADADDGEADINNPPAIRRRPGLLRRISRWFRRKFGRKSTPKVDLPLGE